MLKIALAATTALAIAGASVVYAQQPPAAAPGAATQAPAAPQATDSKRTRLSAEDFSALADARIAAIKAGLRLTAEQEKQWPAVESALRDLAKQRADRMVARRDAQRPTDPIARMRARAEAMSSAGAGLKRLADASEPLYKSLDDGQKRRLAMLSRGFNLRGDMRRMGRPDRSR